MHNNGTTDTEGTTVTFSQGTVVDGIMPVTTTITGTPSNRIFVNIEVTQTPRVMNSIEKNPVKC